MYGRLGDEQARHLLASCLSVMTREVVRHHGTLVKSIGDEILCTFPLPGQALLAAKAMQVAVDGVHPKGEVISIRVGFHYGDVILEAGDVYGDTVNVAARVASITRARQIMTTRAAADALPPELRNKVQQIMRAEFRGKQEALDVFQAVWEQDGSMTTRIGTLELRKPSEARNELLLRYRQKILIVSEQHRNIIIGRGDTCDIMVLSNLASRQHARVELNFSKFVLTDHSANGTYIRFTDKHVIHLSHQEIILHGSGVISLGQNFSESPSEIIEFIIQ